MKKQVHVFYNGRVQGVGFRFAAKDIAGELGVTGWVKNLGNGAVEIVAEAGEDVLKDFLNRMQKYFSSYIYDAKMNWEEATDEFKGFEIKF